MSFFDNPFNVNNRDSSSSGAGPFFGEEGLFKKIGGGANGIFGAVTGLGSEGLASAPTYQATQTDPATKGLIQAEQQRSQQSPQALAEQMGRSTGAAASLNSPGQINRENAALGGSSNSQMSQAIQNKALRAFGSNQATLQQQAQTQAVQMKQQLMTAAMNDSVKAQYAQIGALQQQNEAAYQFAQARNQTISGLMGGVGKIGGAFAARKKSPSSPNEDSDNSAWSGGENNQAGEGADFSNVG